MYRFYQLRIPTSEDKAMPFMCSDYDVTQMLIRLNIWACFTIEDFQKVTKL